METKSLRTSSSFGRPIALHRIRKYCLPLTILFFLLLLTSSRVYADSFDHFFTFSDPIDSFHIDLTEMFFEFEKATGDYSIRFTADPAHPFDSDFRINVNLFNPNGSPLVLFQDTFNDFNLSVPTTTMILTGTNAMLLEWSAGDRVAVNWEAGRPPGVTFFTAVTAFQGGYEYNDFLNSEGGFDFSPNDYAVIQAVPEPAITTLLLVSGLVGLAGYGRKKFLKK